MAEELTQQTFYKAFLHIERFKGKCSLYTWLCTIGKNEWLIECRKQKSVPLDFLLEEPEGAGPEEEILLRDRQIIVRKAIRELQEPYREVVILRLYGELAFAEVARYFDKSEGWAKVTYFRGKEKLKKELEGKI